MTPFSTRRIIALAALLGGILTTSIPAIAGTVCPCAGGPACQLEKGREEKTFTYNPNDMSTYDALEQAAMAEADQKAADKATQAAAKYAGKMCPAPKNPADGTCGALETATDHGKPFAGGSKGHGIARSLWHVTYVCQLQKKKVEEPPKPVNVNPGANGGPTDGGGGGGGVGGGGGTSKIDIPPVPRCFPFTLDAEEFIEHLRDLRRQAATNLPLGSDGGPEWEKAVAQSKADMAQIDAEIKQAQATPLCPPVNGNTPVHTGPGGGGTGGGGGGSLPPPNVDIPPIPKCFGLPVDKDEFLDELHKMRARAATNLPLGAEKGDPEFEKAADQANANVQAIDDAIKQAEATPMCPPKKASFWDDFFGHVSVGVGVGVGTGGGHHDHGDEPHQDHTTPHD